MTLPREDNDTCSRFFSFLVFSLLFIFFFIFLFFLFFFIFFFPTPFVIIISQLAPPPIPQVLDKGIMTLYTLLPNELKGQQPAAAAAEQQQQQQQQQAPAKEEKDPFGDWDPFGSTNEAEKVSAVEAEMTEIVQAVKQSASDLSGLYFGVVILDVFLFFSFNFFF